MSEEDTRDSERLREAVVDAFCGFLDVLDEGIAQLLEWEKRTYPYRFTIEPTLYRPRVGPMKPKEKAA